MRLRIRFRTGESPVPAGPGMRFASLATGRVPRTGTLLSSVAVHLVVIVLITVVSRQIALWAKDDEVDWSRYSVEPLRIHLAEPLFFRASDPGKAQAPKPAAARAAGSAGGQQRRGVWIADACCSSQPGTAYSGRKCQQCSDRDPARVSSSAYSARGSCRRSLSGRGRAWTAEASSEPGNCPGPHGGAVTFAEAECAAGGCSTQQGTGAGGHQRIAGPEAKPGSPGSCRYRTRPLHRFGFAPLPRRKPPASKCRPARRQM